MPVILGIVGFVGFGTADQKECGLQKQPQYDMIFSVSGGGYFPILALVREIKEGASRVFNRRSGESRREVCAYSP